MNPLLDRIGEWHQVYTLVDFVQYIKGVEYLICLAFFIGFPIFYRYLNGHPEAPRKEGRS